MSTSSKPLRHPRRYPVGAELTGRDGVSFRVWAPSRARVEVLRDDGTVDVELDAEGNGYFSGQGGGLRAGDLYRIRLDGDAAYPDPASRFQPEGHDGPSLLLDPDDYAWRDSGWKGVSRHGQIIYEIHIGTFTPEGTWAAAAARLPGLAELGVTVLELMPVGEFPGRFGWGYDVVHFFAPTRLYGTPDELRRFVDDAHALGIGVILDVVYNHCATVGCFLPQFGSGWFSRKYRSDWGHALNFDDPEAAPVREFFVANAQYWIREFHLDGYRLDATQSILDASEVHILSEISAGARAAAGSREILLIGENEPQDVAMLAPATERGAGLDALWNDDFHHTARVALTGRTEAYYADYRGTPQEFVSSAKHGFLYQGQYYVWQKKRRGTPARGLDATRFVNFLQNHDQIANSARGLRLHELTTPGLYRAATALLLLLPQTPMLFQGQEFAASSPFLYFADNAPENAGVVAEGRREFLSQFPSIAAGGHAWLCDPASTGTFERCKLDHRERELHATAFAMHRDLIALRRTDRVFSTQSTQALDGAVLANEAFVLRYFGESGDDRLLVVNFGRALDLEPYPEPLLAPPGDGAWVLAWSSDDVKYGGDGTPRSGIESWQVPAHAALVYRARRESRRSPTLPGQGDTH